MNVDQKYIENGFFTFNTGLENNLRNIRTKFTKIFDNSARMNGLNPIKNDKDVTDFSKTNHELWVSSYDQLRFLPEVLAISNEQTILKNVKKCGIKFPVVDEIVLRGDIPYDDQWRREIHQDSHYFQGSMNSVIIWLPFQDIDSKIGPLEVVNGSHKNGSISDQGKSINDSKFTSITMKLGDALVFSQFLVHRSGKNRSSDIRFSLQLRINDLNDDEWAKRKFFFPKRKFVNSPRIDFPTYFPF